MRMTGSKLILGIFHDLTEHRRAEEDLRESEERFRIMADCCPAIMWVTNAEGLVRFVNRAYREFFGIAGEQVEGRKWRPQVHPDDEGKPNRRWQRSVERHASFTAEARMQRADGSGGGSLPVGSRVFPRAVSSSGTSASAPILPIVNRRKRH